MHSLPYTPPRSITDRGGVAFWARLLGALGVSASPSAGRVRSVFDDAHPGGELTAHIGKPGLGGFVPVVGIAPGPGAHRCKQQYHSGMAVAGGVHARWQFPTCGLGRA